MKICVIGAGSIFFTRQLVNGMVKSKAFHNAELALVDIDEHKCVEMGRFCQKMVEENEASIEVTYTTDRLEALPGSDYVVLTYAIHNYHYRETGTQLAKNFGIQLVSGETTGPSGVLRVVRTIPEILNVAHDIEKLCPKAMVINYVNPTNVVGTALDRYTKANWYAFCDGLYGYLPKMVGSYVGEDKGVAGLDGLDFKVGGVNHFTWLYELKRDGQDLWPDFKEGLKRASDEGGVDSFARAEWELCEVFDAWPALIGHNIEYVRYFQGKGSRPERDYRVKQWDLNNRISWMKRVWWEIRNCNEGKMSTKDIMRDGTDMIAAVLESIENDLNLSFPVNVRNEGRISNLPDSTVIEAYGTFGKDKIAVPPIGEFPRGPLGLTHQVIDEQELALEAAMTGDFNTLVKAIACDPVVMSMNDAKDLAHNLLALEEEDLGPLWDSYWEGRRFNTFH
jgi:alpha-galactosidase